MALSVSKISVEDLRFDDVDLIVAATGYEPRCTHVVERLARQWRVPSTSVGEKLLLLRFKRHASVPTRLANDGFFDQFAPQMSLEVDDHDGPLVVSAVRNTALLRGTRALSHVLVDYTAMTRGLYLCLIRLLREDIGFTFSYSIGRYGRLQRKYPVSSLGAAIRSVPGLEGAALASRPRFCMFGLGYDGIGTRALADRLEAGSYGVFWADPGASEDAPGTTREANASLIGGAVVSFQRGISDVAGVYEALTLVSAECEHTHKVLLCPVGPKPHTLAAGLASFENDHTALLAPHAAGAGMTPEELPLISAEGRLVLTRVQPVR